MWVLRKGLRFGNAESVMLFGPKRSLILRRPTNLFFGQKSHFVFNTLMLDI